jgi:sugar lactone lactonase YvrE
LTPSTTGYVFTSLSYDNKSFNTTRDINDIAISSDGTKIYYISNNGFVNQRVLSTAYDISTAGSEVQFDQSSQDNDPRDVTFKPDGTKMYVTGDQYNQVAQYSLSTAWDVTTASYDTKFKQVQSQMTAPKSTQFKSDGTKMYVTTTTVIYEYSLSTAWDITTASYTNNSLNVSSQDGGMQGIFLKPDGTKMYTTGTNNNKIYIYNFGTAWDLSTLTYSNNSYAMPQGDNARGIAISSDGTKLYTGHFGNAHIYQSSIGSLALTLGTGSFASTDVGKRIVGNGGDVILTSTAGVYDTTGGSAFTDSSTIASGSWSMRGLKSVGDADGIGLSGAVEINPINFASASYDNKTVSTGTQATSEDGVFFKPDGTRMYVLATGGGTHKIWQYDLSTVWDVSTASYNGVSKAISLQTSNAGGIFFKPDGLQMFTVDRANTQVDIYTLSTAWDLSTLSYSTNQYIGNFAAQPFGIFFKPDGTKMYICDANTDNVRERTLTTAWDVSTNGSGQSFSFASQETDPHDVEFTSDGLKMYIVGRGSDRVHEYDLSTAWDVTSASYDNVYLDVSGQGTQPNGLHLKADDQSKLYVVFSDSVNSVMQYSTGASTSYYQPTSSYHIAVTNSGGQIDTNFWTDINTMVADQDAGDGTVHYAVSTDDRTTWSVIKEGSGVRPIVRDNSGTWQYNSDAGVTTLNTDISDATYSNKSFDFSTQTTGLRSVFFKTDGTSMYSIAGGNSGYIHQYSLSTAWDVSSASYANKNFFTGGFDGSPEGLYIKPDGTKAYYVGKLQDTVRRLSLSTAWDMSTAAYDGNGISVAGQEASLTDIWFKPDGTRMYVIGTDNDTVYQYTLSTAWDETTASNTASFSVASQGGAPSGVTFNTAGTKMYVAGEGTVGVSQYTLSTAWDVSSASYDSVLLDVSSTVGGVQGAVFGDNGSKIYVSAQTGSTVYQYTNAITSYTTSTTWANSTTNDEFYALQEALGETEFNRMDKTQLDAVTDPNHYTLGDTLDLAIALRTDTASASTPTADGVTINYDAASLNQGAVLGTDYDYDFPDSTTVRVTSNAAQNLKIRVV